MARYIHHTAQEISAWQQDIGFLESDLAKHQDFFRPKPQLAALESEKVVPLPPRAVAVA